MESLQLAKEFANAFADKVGQDIKILKVEELTTLADYFVLVTGQSNTQVRALADAAEDRLSELGLPAPRREGRGGESWVLMDAGSVIAHVFTREAREYYQLEKLWADADIVDFDDSFASMMGDMPTPDGMPPDEESAGETPIDNFTRMFDKMISSKQSYSFYHF